MPGASNNHCEFRLSGKALLSLGSAWENLQPARGLSAQAVGRACQRIMTPHARLSDLLKAGLLGSLVVADAAQKFIDGHSTALLVQRLSPAAALSGRHVPDYADAFIDDLHLVDPAAEDERLLPPTHWKCD
eukprot:919190-Amphidinium_carterae.3